MTLEEDSNPLEHAVKSDDLIGIFFRQTEHTILTTEEEAVYIGDLIDGRIAKKQLHILGENSDQDLEALIEKGLIAREELIKHNIRTVVSVAKKYIRKDDEFSTEKFKDLISHGLIGLVKAADSFDPNRGTKFSTWAVTCIRQEMSNFFARNYDRMKTPSHMTTQLRYYKYIYGLVVKELEIPNPTVEQISDFYSRNSFQLKDPPNHFKPENFGLYSEIINRKFIIEIDKPNDEGDTYFEIPHMDDGVTEEGFLRNNAQQTISETLFDLANGYTISHLALAVIHLKFQIPLSNEQLGVINGFLPVKNSPVNHIGKEALELIDKPDGVTYDDIAPYLGIAQQSASDLVRRAIQRIQNLENEKSLEALKALYIAIIQESEA